MEECIAKFLLYIFQNLVLGYIYTEGQASAAAAVAVAAAAAQAASSNAGQWWCLKIGPRPIPKCHHWPALDDAAAAADTWRSVWVRL